MHTPEPSFTMKKWHLFGSAFFIALITFKPVGHPISHGIDPSWEFAINHLFHYGMVSGRDWVFTYGPLGFLSSTVPIGNNVIIASIFTFLLYFLVSLFSITILNKNSDNKKIFIASLFFPLLFLSLPLYRMNYLLLITLMLLWLFHNTKKQVFYILALSISAIGILIKFPIGIACYSFIGSYVLFDAIKNKTFSGIFLPIVISVFLYFLLWLLIHHSLDGSILFIFNSLSLSTGSTSAHTINKGSNILLIVLSLTLFLLPYLLLHRKQPSKEDKFFTGTVSFVAAFVWYKYSISREDSGHLVAWVEFLIVTSVFSCIIINKWKSRALIIIFSLASALTWAANAYSVDSPIRIFKPKMFNTPKKITKIYNFDKRKKRLTKISTRKLKKQKIPSAIRNNIGATPVTIYPTNLSIAHSEQLNWVPIPVLQHYAAYSPHLEEQNVSFFNQNNAPPLLLWNDNSLTTFSSSYLPNSIPLTYTEIIKKYKPVTFENKYMLLERTGGSQISKTEKITSEEISWDEWLPIPESNFDITYLHLEHSRSLRGALNLALFKENDIHIEYKIAGKKETKKHRLLLENSSNGIWASPYLNTTYPGITIQKINQVAALKEIPEKVSFHIREYSPSRESIFFEGWAFVDDPTLEISKRSNTFLLLENNKNFYYVQADNFAMVDNAKKLSRDGLDINPNTLGWRVNISRKNLPDKNTNLYIGIVSRGSYYISKATKLYIPPASNFPRIGNKVEAIKVSSRNSWAFDSKLSAEWRGANILADCTFISCPKLPMSVSE